VQLKKTETDKDSLSDQLQPAVSFEDIDRASRVLSGYSHLTPVHTSRYLNHVCDADVFLKCENFQRTGAFKFRGAFNALSALARESDVEGVLTYSSGNHGQALSLAGQILGIPVSVIMPDDAPDIKKRATAGYGATIISYNKFEITREALAIRIASEKKLPIIPPYNHVDVVAGQGTVCKELHEEIDGLDLLLVPCGGGGLLSGSAIATKHINPSCRVIGVEPANADDATRSFRSGSIQTVDNPDTVADGARTPYLGSITFPLIMQNVDDMVTVSEASIISSMALIWERMKLIVEPTGALALAALIEKKIDVSGARVGVVVSGGNVDVRTAISLFERFASPNLQTGITR
jgi:threonine dehydratase